MLKPSVQTHNVDGILVAEFWDCLRLDPAPVQDLRKHYEAHVQKGGRPELVIELSGVGFAGSAALGNFVALHRLVRQNGGRIIFSDVDPTVAEVFRASKLESLFEFVADRAAALLRDQRTSGESPGGGSQAGRKRRHPRRELATRRAEPPAAPGEVRRLKVEQRPGQFRLIRRPSSFSLPKKPCIIGGIDGGDQPIGRPAIRESGKSASVRGSPSLIGTPGARIMLSRADGSSKGITRGFLAGVWTMAVTPRIHVNEMNGITVIRFQDRQLFDERTVREVADQILAALPNDNSPIRLILDFSDVNLISSTLLSKLILLQRRVANSGGKLRLCEMSSVIQQVFRTSNLDRLFSIDRDQRASVDSFH